MFGGTIDSKSGLDDLLSRLEIFSDRWDFRRMARERGALTDDEQRHGHGAARWLTTADGLSPETQARILENSSHLGLIHATEPSLQTYDCILALGGARLSCMLRPLRAGEVIRSGVTAAMVGLLGAPRPIPESERDATDIYAPGAADEFELIVAGGQQAFGFNARQFDEQRYDSPTNLNLGWVIRRFEATLNERSFPVVAVSAPSSEPERRRANSADTLTFFLERQHVPQNARILLITSQIYVPYVQLEALRTVAIPRKLFVETIGFPADRMPKMQGLSNPNHYLQEIRSTIQAARRFCRSYPE